MLPPPLATQEASLVAALARDLGCPHSLAGILARRGIAHPSEGADFLAPKLKRLSDPFLLPEMRAAVERTLAAMDRGERIVLYGDYDVDGVTSLALLVRMPARWVSSTIALSRSAYRLVAMTANSRLSSLSVSVRACFISCSSNQWVS